MQYRDRVIMCDLVQGITEDFNEEVRLMLRLKEGRN